MEKRKEGRAALTFSKQEEFKNRDVSLSGFAVSLWLYRKLYDDLEEFCQEYGVSKSKVTREAIARFLDEVDYEQ